jgi:HPr kinase/phosphorylase
MRQPAPFKKESITVPFLIEHLREDVGMPVVPVSEVGLEERAVTEPNIHRPGLALAGFTELFTHHRVQVLGNTECRYLAHLDMEGRRKAFDELVQFPIPCLFLTDGNSLDGTLVQRAAERQIPVYRTEVPTTEFMYHLRDFLEDQFALQQTVHASLVDVYGVGLMLTGKSGIGKSEVALDLVERGHRLVADDVVVATQKAEGVLMGSGTHLAQHFMEIRGVGIVDVRAMFGIRAIRFQKRIELIVDMEVWDASREYTRLGMSGESRKVLGVELPLVRLPIVPGKNVTVICEVIAMNHLLRHYGYDAAEVMAQRLSDRIRNKTGPAPPLRGIEYFEHDFE